MALRDKEKGTVAPRVRTKTSSLNRAADYYYPTLVFWGTAAASLSTLNHELSTKTALPAGVAPA